MELTIDNRKKEINKKYKFNLSFWDLVFWQNNSNKIRVNSETEVKKKLDETIDEELSRFFDIKNSPNYFEIATENNPDLDRYFNARIDFLVALGQAKEAENVRQNSILEKQNMAKTFGEKQFEEFKHIFDFFAGSNYPKSFKCLLLNEALQNSYRMDFSGEKPRLIVNSRKPNQTILGLINLPTEVIDYICSNAPKYLSFKALYKDSQIEFQKQIAQKSGVNFESVNTFGKGQWIKFESKQSDPKNFEANVAKLKALVADTPWCTSTLASSHLSTGDFYVFVDNKSKAHIAVKMNGNAIDEVRGIKNGKSQELEDEYRDVALNFLENNKEIENGKKWFLKEEWNKRLVKYRQQIEDGTFSEAEVENLIKDFRRKDYKAHFNKNGTLDDLKSVLPLAVPVFAKYFNCSCQEICVGDYKVAKYETNCPYKIILGNADFTLSSMESLVDLRYIGGKADFNLSQIKSLGNLQYIGGNAVFSHSKIQDLGNLRYIGGDGDFLDCKILDLGKLQHIGGNASFTLSGIESLGDLRYIGGNAWFSFSKITNLGKLQHIGENAHFDNVKLTSTGNLETVGKNIYVIDCQMIDIEKIKQLGGKFVADSRWNSEKQVVIDTLKEAKEYMQQQQEQVVELMKKYNCSKDEIFMGDYKPTENETVCPYKIILGNAVFPFSNIQSLGDLRYIGGNADFSTSKIVHLRKLQHIGGSAKFFGSKVECLGKLQCICGNANFISSEVKTLGILKAIGGDVHFRDSQLTDLGQLQKVGGNANFCCSKIDSLCDLKIIGEDAVFRDSMVTDLGNLQSIGGKAFFDKSKLTSTGNIETFGKDIYVADTQILEIDRIKQLGGKLIVLDKITKEKFSIDNLQDAKEYMRQKIVEDGQKKLEEANDIISQFKERNQQNKQNNKNANPNNNPVA